MGLLSFLLGSARCWRASNGERVEFRRTWQRTGVNDPSVYEEWTAPSARAAKEFLNTRTIERRQYYLVVETPEGNWGRDRLGVYKE